MYIMTSQLLDIASDVPPLSQASEHFVEGGEEGAVKVPSPRGTLRPRP